MMLMPAPTAAPPSSVGRSFGESAAHQPPPVISIAAAIDSKVRLRSYPTGRWG